jgi:hypothetical protein
VDSGASNVAKKTCLHLRHGEYGNCIGLVSRGNGERWMDQRIWSTCLYRLIHANYDLADCMKIQIKKLRFDSSQSTLPEDWHTRGPAFRLFTRTRGNGGTTHLQTSSNYPFPALSELWLPRRYRKSLPAPSIHVIKTMSCSGFAELIPFHSIPEITLLAFSRAARRKLGEPSPFPTVGKASLP